MAYVKKLKYLFKPCKQCGLMMRGTAKQLEGRVFCSRQCNADDRKAHNLRKCAECGSDFHSRLGGNSKTKGSGSYCSKACYAAYISRAYTLHSAHVTQMRKALKKQAAQLDRLARKAQERVASQKRKEELLALSVCGCGNPSSKPGARCAACKAERAASVRRAHRAKYKAKRRMIERGERAEAIDPMRVFELFGWKCQRCGRKTPKKLRGSYEPRAPELDHIVSLAEGGLHVWANVQCLCRECNLMKGARSVGQIGLGFS